MKGIGILPGYRPHYIDHLVPLCHCMNIPLLVTDASVQTLIEWYYPPMEILLVEAADYLLDPFLAPYDTFFYVDFSRKGTGTFQFHEYIARKKGRSVISLHGNPDKYGDSYWLENLADEDIVLAYGPQLNDLLEKKNIRKLPVICGNYRLEFYKAHEPFFDAKFPFKKDKEVLLYAPTWGSKEKDSSLFGHYSTFLDVYHDALAGLSQVYQVIVKFHPLLKITVPNEIEEVRRLFPEILFLDDFPLVYPVLKQADVYVGDYSSLGYDFLYFDRPLFFLEPREKTPLHACGTSIQKNHSMKLEEKGGAFLRKEMYKYAFGEKKELASLKEEIEHALLR